MSGLPNAEYVRQHSFAVAGMPSTRFCSNALVVPKAPHGYDTVDGELRHARYLDFSCIYAAGAICSTPGDLIAWMHALHNGRILGASACQALVTPDTLLDGTGLR